MNTKKIIAGLLDADYRIVQKMIINLELGQSIMINQCMVTLIEVKTVSYHQKKKKDIHYIRIEKDGKFVAKIGIEK